MLCLKNVKTNLKRPSTNNLGRSLADPTDLFEESLKSSDCVNIISNYLQITYIFQNKANILKGKKQLYYLTKSIIFILKTFNKFKK